MIIMTIYNNSDEIMVTDDGDLFACDPPAALND